MSNKIKLPEYWPILEAEDMYIGMFTGFPSERGETHCLLGWLGYLYKDSHFLSTYDLCDESVYKKIKATINEIIGKEESIASWNDTHSLQECADVWNETGRRLGYDIDTPIDW